MVVSFEECVGLVSLIKGNLRLLYPDADIDIVVGKHDGKERATAVAITTTADELPAKVEILMDGPVTSFPGRHSYFALEGLYKETKTAVGAKLAAGGKKNKY